MKKRQKYSTLNWIVSLTVTILLVTTKVLLYYTVYEDIVLNGIKNPLFAITITIIMAEFLYMLLLTLCMDEFEEDAAYFTIPLTSIVFIIFAGLALLKFKVFDYDKRND